MPENTATPDDLSRLLDQPVHAPEPTEREAHQTQIEHARSEANGAWAGETEEGEARSANVARLALAVEALAEHVARLDFEIAALNHRLRHLSGRVDTTGAY